MTDNKEQLIAVLVNKGLDGDMDAVNAYDDRMVRAKAKAMIVKVNKGTAERPPMPQSSPPASSLAIGCKFFIKGRHAFILGE